MHIWRCGIFLWLASVPLGAGTIVTSLPGVALGTGDTLSFTFLEWSYRSRAAAFGAPADPARLRFTLVTGSADGMFDFSAELESSDGAIGKVIDNTGVGPGVLQGALYQGLVWTAYGSVDLSPALSSQLFAGPSAQLVLRNLGPSVFLSLSPYTVAQDMRVSLSGGGLSVGGTVVAVSYQGALVASDAIGPTAAADIGLSAPEPGSGELVGLGAGLACLLAWRLKRNRGRLKTFSAL